MPIKIILFALAINCVAGRAFLLGMEPRNPDIVPVNVKKVPRLLKLCSKAIVNLILASEKTLPGGPLANIKRKLPAELIDKIALTLKQNPQSWTYLKDQIDCKQLNFIDRHLYVTMAISQDNTIIVISYLDKTAKEWDTQSGLCLHILKGHTDIIRLIEISKNNKFIVTGSDDNSIKIWQTESGTCLKTFNGHKNYILALAISLDNELIASGSLDGEIKLWKRKEDTNSDKCFCTPLSREALANKDCVTTVAISSDKQFIIAGCGNKAIKIWGWENDFSNSKIIDENDCSIVSVILSLNNKFLIIVNSLNKVKIFRLESGRYETCSAAHAPCQQVVELKTILTKHNCWINETALSSDNRFMITGSYDNTAKIWDIKSGNCLYSFETNIGYITSVHINNNKFTITKCDGEIVEIWQITYPTFEKFLKKDTRPL